MNVLGGSNSQNEAQKQSGGGGLMGTVNNALGGGQSGERNEDVLDKGVDFVQERVLGQGPQNNESAVEQAKDERISDFVRQGYRGTTGKDFPVQDKS